MNTQLFRLLRGLLFTLGFLRVKTVVHYELLHEIVLSATEGNEAVSFEGLAVAATLDGSF